MKRSAFTLIELMVVILVISLLAVMVFRMVAAVGKGNDKASTRATLEKVSHALEEFKAQYGKYPPVPSYEGSQPLAYEFPNANSRGWGDNPEATAKKFLDFEKNGGEIQWGGGGKNKGTFFTFGLVSFFLPRYNGTASRGPKSLTGVGKGTAGQNNKDSLAQWRSFNKKVSNKVGDSAKDMNACRKILPYLDGGIDEAGNIDYGIIRAWNGGARTLNCSQAEIVVTNYYYTIHDAWEHELQYVSRPPYESYILRSRGPDGKTVGDTCDSNDHGHTKKKKASDGKEHWLIQDGDVETEDDIVAGVE